MTDAELEADEFHFEARGGGQVFHAMPLSNRSYRDLELHGLGGDFGIFILAETEADPAQGFSALGKAVDEDAATQIVMGLALLAGRDRAPVTPEALAWGKEETARIEAKEAARDRVVEAARATKADLLARANMAEANHVELGVGVWSELVESLAALEEQS